MAQFGAKTANLIAAVQSSIVWGLADFSSVLGQDQGIIKAPVSLSLQVSNTTAQVCYIGLQYTTVTNSYNLADRRSIAAVPANSSINITPITVPTLGSIGPNVQSITVTLTSAAAGAVSILLNIDPPVAGSGASAGGAFGLDDRSNQDYILKFTGLNSQIFSGGPGNTIINSLYTCPVGKRALLENLTIFLPQTPVVDAEITITVQWIAGSSFNLYTVYSSSGSNISLVIPAQFFRLESGQGLQINGVQNTGYFKVSSPVTAVCNIREIF